MSLHDTIEAVKAEAERGTSIVQSAIALIRGLAEAAKNAMESGDDDELKAVLDSMHSGADELAAAVVANTPADPATTGDTATGDTATTGDESTAG